MCGNNDSVLLDIDKIYHEFHDIKHLLTHLNNSMGELVQMARRFENHLKENGQVVYEQYPSSLPQFNTRNIKNDL